MEVTVIGCKGLLPADSNGKSDPYVTVGLGAGKNAQPARTKTQQATLDPMFGESFVFSVAANGSASDYLLSVAVMDADKIGKDEFCGQVVVDLGAVLSGWRQSEVEQAFEFGDGDGKVSSKLLKKGKNSDNPCGSVQLRLVFTDAAKLRPPSDGVVSVTVVGCKGLLAADSNGLSDPYVTVGLGPAAGGGGGGRKTPHRTKTVAGTLDPSFDESFDFSVKAAGPAEDYRLAIEVKDADKIGKEDLLGLLAVDVGPVLDDWKQTAVVERAFELCDGDGKVSAKLVKTGPADHPLGSVVLRLVYTDVAKLWPPSNGTVRVKVLACKGLMAVDSNGKSDPYVLVCLGGTAAAQRRTKTKEATLDPVYDEDFEFSVMTGGCAGDYRLGLEVKDADAIGKGGPIGTVVVDLAAAFGEGNWCKHLLAGTTANVTLPLGDPANKTPAVTRPAVKAAGRGFGSVQLALLFTPHDPVYLESLRPVRPTGSLSLLSFSLPVSTVQAHVLIPVACTGG